MGGVAVAVRILALLSRHIATTPRTAAAPEAAGPAVDHALCIVINYDGGVVANKWLWPLTMRLRFSGQRDH